MLIFNFHHVETHIFHPERKHITMSPEGLSRFIRTLRLLGMSIVSVRDVLNSPDPAGPQSNRQVLLTFDDGYVNNLTEALPVLEQEHCPATVFVLPGRFSGTNEWDQGKLPESRRDPLMLSSTCRRGSCCRAERYASHPCRSARTGSEHRTGPSESPST